MSNLQRKYIRKNAARIRRRYAKMAALQEVRREECEREARRKMSRFLSLFAFTLSLVALIYAIVR